MFDTFYLGAFNPGPCTRPTRRALGARKRELPAGASFAWIIGREERVAGGHRLVSTFGRGRGGVGGATVFQLLGGRGCFVCCFAAFCFSHNVVLAILSPLDLRAGPHKPDSRAMLATLAAANHIDPPLVLLSQPHSHNLDGYLGKIDLIEPVA